MNARVAIRHCLETYGKEALDVAFKQLKQSPFLTGEAPSGWTPDILWIFNLKNFERIINGYYTIKRQNSASVHVDSHAEDPYNFTMPTAEEIKQSEQRKYEETRSRWLSNIKLAEENPSSNAAVAVMNAYKAGVLRYYDISWVPPNTHRKPPVKDNGNNELGKITAQDIDYIKNIVNRNK